MSLKAVYDQWGDKSFGIFRVCPGCKKMLRPEQQRTFYRYNRFDRKVPLPNIKYCGDIACLHIMWDQREVILLSKRKLLEPAASRLFTNCQKCEAFIFRGVECPSCAEYLDYVLRARPIFESYRNSPLVPRGTVWLEHYDFITTGQIPRHRPPLVSSRRNTGISLWEQYYARRHRRLFLWKQK